MEFWQILQWNMCCRGGSYQSPHHPFIPYACHASVMAAFILFLAHCSDCAVMEKRKKNIFFLLGRRVHLSILVLLHYSCIKGFCRLLSNRRQCLRANSCEVNKGMNTGFSAERMCAVTCWGSSDFPDAVLTNTKPNAEPKDRVSSFPRFLHKKEVIFGKCTSASSLELRHLMSSCVKIFRSMTKVSMYFNRWRHHISFHGDVRRLTRNARSK